MGRKSKLGRNEDETKVEGRLQRTERNRLALPCGSTRRVLPKMEVGRYIGKGSGHKRPQTGDWLLWIGIDRTLLLSLLPATSFLEAVSRQTNVDVLRRNQESTSPNSH